MINALHYAEDGVHQCWTCQNCAGKADAKLNMLNSDDLPTTIIVALPMCKHTDEYMTWVRRIPCEKYIPVIHGGGVEDDL